MAEATRRTNDCLERRANKAPATMITPGTQKRKSDIHDASIDEWKDGDFIVHPDEGDAVCFFLAKQRAESIYTRPLWAEC